MSAKKILLIVLAVLVFIIIVENAGAVSLRIFFWQISMSMIVWLLLFVVIGFVAGYTIGSIRRRANL